MRKRKRIFFYQMQKNLKQHLKQNNTEIDLAHGSVTINADNFQTSFCMITGAEVMEPKHCSSTHEAHPIVGPLY